MTHPDGVPQHDSFRLGDWIVDPNLHRMTRGQMVVRLRPRVMAVLLALAERSGELLPRQDLIDAVWPGGFVADNTVTHTVLELRHALGDDAADARYVETVPRRGYRLVPRIERLPAPAANAAADAARCLLRTGQREMYLIDGDNIIGRASDAQVCVTTTRASRHHARISVSADGAVLEDLGSKNGTLLDGSPVTSSTALSEGDVIDVGGVRFEFHRRDEQGVATETDC